MNHNILIKVCIIMYIYMSNPIFSQENPKSQFGKMNPLFTKYIEARKSGKWIGKIKDKFTGYIPSPIDHSYESSSKTTGNNLTNLPRYDLREYKKVSQPKNQENCNSCWSFATLSAVESSFLQARIL